jgi:hypothetical protein
LPSGGEAHAVGTFMSTEASTGMASLACPAVSLSSGILLSLGAISLVVTTTSCHRAVNWCNVPVSRSSTRNESVVHPTHMDVPEHGKVVNVSILEHLGKLVHPSTGNRMRHQPLPGRPCGSPGSSDSLRSLPTCPQQTALMEMVISFESSRLRLIGDGRFRAVTVRARSRWLAQRQIAEGVPTAGHWIAISDH